MGKQAESNLQERIQKLITSRGGYGKKNWGNMTSASGYADLTFCYKGFYIAIEVKVDNNYPSKQQGIHCRNVKKAGGITLIAKDTDTVSKLLDYVDYLYYTNTNTRNPNDYYAPFIKRLINNYYTTNKLDDGTKW